MFIFGAEIRKKASYCDYKRNNDGWEKYKFPFDLDEFLDNVQNDKIKLDIKPNYWVIQKIISGTYKIEVKIPLSSNDIEKLDHFLKYRRRTWTELH